MARPGGFPVTNPKSDYETNPIGPLFSTKAQNESQIPARGDGPEARSAPQMGLCSRGWPHAGTPRTTQRNVTECYAENDFLLPCAGCRQQEVVFCVTFRNIPLCCARRPRVGPTP